jgi:lysophospholipase L1-like esterase
MGRYFKDADLFHGCLSDRKEKALLLGMKKCTLILLLGLIAAAGFSQDPLRFTDEIAKLKSGDSSVNKTNLIVFAGSSSFRMWRNLKESFPNHNVLNRGFGSSEMSDLVYYADQLIIDYSPRQILIYEGDNDLNHGKSSAEILKDADQLLSIIRRKLPEETSVIFLTPKPSPSRWHLKKNYIRFNRKLKRWGKHQHDVKVIDVWTPLLVKGEPIKEIFLEDNLHMNAAGYARWTEIIAPYLIK